MGTWRTGVKAYSGQARPLLTNIKNDFLVLKCEPIAASLGLMCRWECVHLPTPYTSFRSLIKRIFTSLVLHAFKKKSVFLVSQVLYQMSVFITLNN